MESNNPSPQKPRKKSQQELRKEFLGKLKETRADVWKEPGLPAELYVRMNEIIEKMKEEGARGRGQKKSPG
jgi:hypothetical protein